MYQDIAKRTDGDIYVGVVGPVRTGKSTFIKRFMDLLVIPNIDNEYKKERAKDELPQSAGGRTIMTTEPKFVPNEAIEITLNDNSGVQLTMVLPLTSMITTVTFPEKIAEISEDIKYTLCYFCETAIRGLP